MLVADFLSPAELAEFDAETREEAERARGNGADKHEAPAAPERAPPIGEPFTPKLFPIERWKDIAFDLNEEWQIDGVMPKLGVGVIFGASQSFKSFLAMHTSLCTARGLTWAGRRVEFASVVYIAAEGAGGLRKRKAGYEAAWARDAAKIGAEPPANIEFALISAAPNLGTMGGDLPALIATIDSINARPGLIVLDTAAKAMGGADENNQGAAALLCNGEALSRHYECFVLLVHHTGWGDEAQKRTRGWSGLPFGLDLIMLCERKSGELSVTLTIQKLKDDELGERFVAKLERVELGKTKTGREISTLIVDSVTQIENAPAVATGVTGKRRLRKRCSRTPSSKRSPRTARRCSPAARPSEGSTTTLSATGTTPRSPNNRTPTRRRPRARRGLSTGRSKTCSTRKFSRARKIRGRRALWFA